MKGKIKQQWLEALRSGEYKQGQSYLKNGNNFCCIGVLCDLYVKEHKNEIEWSTKNVIGEDFNVDSVFSIHGCYETIPEQVRNWAGLTSIPYTFLHGSQHALSDLNDAQGMSFKKIADIIEEKFKVTDWLQLF